MRGAFETFFPGAQWVGDGAELTIHIGPERFSCNLELMVDADSGAFTGASVRPTEDAAAVTEAFRDGAATTGAQPLALLLDNKPSNHGEDVDEALDETLRIRSRPYVPTDKPHVEGAFGLFAQEAPNLAIHATTLEELAREVRSSGASAEPARCWTETTRDTRGNSLRTCRRRPKAGRSQRACSANASRPETWR
jgi:hypothetical protein